MSIAICETCIHHKVDENGNDYCDELQRYIDFIKIYCVGVDYEPQEEENE